MKVNELTSSAPHTSGWRRTQAETAHTVTIPPTGLPSPTAALHFPHSRHETALCSSLIESRRFHCTHSYCKQTLRHGKLQHALAGSLLGSSRHRLALRCPSRYLRVNRSSSGRTRSSHMGGLEVWVDHENRPIFLTSVTTSLLVCMHESE
jgi:hypothetical protein